MRRIVRLFAAVQGVWLSLFAGQSLGQGADFQAWTRAQQLNTIDGYREFLSRFPDSPFASNAFRAMVDGLVAPQVPNRGFGAPAGVPATPAVPGVRRPVAVPSAGLY